MNAQPNKKETSTEMNPCDEDTSKQVTQCCNKNLPEGLCHFPQELVFQYYAPHMYNYGYHILPTQQKNMRDSSIMEQLSLKNHNMAQKWKDFIRTPERGKLSLPSERNFRFVNYRLQYVVSDSPAASVMRLKPGPVFDGKSQCPIPGNLLNQYRHRRLNIK